MQNLKRRKWSDKIAGVKLRYITQKWQKIQINCYFHKMNDLL